MNIRIKINFQKIECFLHIIEQKKNYFVVVGVLISLAVI
jgi:hypothetical protein